MSQAGTTSTTSTTSKLVFNSFDQPNISLPPPAPSRGHQRSRTTIDLPPLFTRSPSILPTKSSTFIPFNKRSRESSPEARPTTSIAGSEATTPELQRKTKSGAADKIASWFEGSSEPVNIVLIPSPNKEISAPSFPFEVSDTSSTEDKSIMDNLTQRPRKQTTSTASGTNVSRFSFFKKSTTVSQTNSDPNDLVQMDVKQALLSNNVGEEGTANAFKTLQQNAESLLRRFQLSYTENLSALKQITAEKRVQADELEASQTRSEHLKLQLLEMAEKASEQEKMIASLKTELANPQQSVRMITDDDEDFRARHRGHKGRFSDASSSDESFVDSEMSSAMSVFSEVESIRTPSTSVAPSPPIKHASLYSPTFIHSPRVKAQVTPVLNSRCQDCHNTSASEAWNVVEMMKMENTCLKQRISELESAQDSALDFLTALRF